MVLPTLSNQTIGGVMNKKLKEMADEAIKQFKGEGVKLDLHQEQRILNLVTLAALQGSVDSLSEQLEALKK